MKIAYVLKKFPRLSETFILNELLGLESLGHEVVIFSLRPAPDEPRHIGLSKLKASIHLVPTSPPLDSTTPKKDFDDFLVEIPPRRRSKTWAQGLQVASLCRTHNVDHVHAHFMTVASHVAAISRLNGGPSFTVTAHAKDIFRNQINVELFQKTAALAESLVTVSEFNRNYIESRFLSDSRTPVAMIYNGLPLDEMSRDPKKKQGEHPQLLAVGRLVEKKGFDLLLRACHYLKDRQREFHLTLVGDGDQLSSLQSLIVELKLDDCVTLTGPLSREKVIDLMYQSHMLVLPCREGRDGNRDALPTVLIEALACGLPCVSTRMVGIPEIVVDGECGILTDPDDFSAIAVAMMRLMDDEKLRAHCAKNGPVRSRQVFDQKTTLPALVHVFQKSILESPDRGVTA